jgi:hypothetical protein
MKIISDFDDYYDHFQEVNSSETPSIIYMRRTHCLDLFVSLKVQEDLNLDLDGIRSISDKVLYPTWSISPFIIGASGRFNRGVKIVHNDHVDHSYTITGAYHISRRMGIDITPEITGMIDKHFENPIFDKPCIFKTVGAPVFMITFNTVGIAKFIVNPRLADYCYFKACKSVEIYSRIKAFIDNFLIPCDAAMPYARVTRRTPRILGLKASGWSLHDGLPKGY